MKKIIISPPFSNILPNSKYYTRIIGTYTLKRRRGLWRVFTTLKKVKDGWFNKVGLRNPGIDRAPNKACIISISQLRYGDFDKMLNVLSKKKRVLGVEFNISCPNANVLGVTEENILKAKDLFKYVIVKLPHDFNNNLLENLINLGVEYIHISNTKLVAKGALSGRDLIKNNVEKIKYLKYKHPKIKIIGGGGIYSLEDYIEYNIAGADYFSLSTILLNPIKAYKLIRKIHD